jgi:hypothetical protein
MKSFGCAWRGLLAVSVVLVVTAPALAHAPGLARLALIGDPTAPPFTPRVLSPGAPIPANGGILIEAGEGSGVIAVVTNPRGEIVEGTTTLLSSGELSYYAWTPAGELGLGAHWVDLRNEGGGSVDMMLIEIVEAADRVLPVLTLSPSIAAFTAPSARACCTTPSAPETDHCALSEQQTLARIDPGLSSMDTVGTLNQFLYRFRPAEGSVAPTEAAIFRAFGGTAALYYEADADEYCFEVDVLDIMTMEEHHQAELGGCIASSSVQLGTMQIELEAEFLADERCFQPPSGHEEQWCEANAGDCSHDLTPACALYRYACEDGPLPADWQVPPEDEPDFAGDDGSAGNAGQPGSMTASRDDGCSVAAPGVERSSAAWQLALGALLLLLARGRSRSPHRT